MASRVPAAMAPSCFWAAAPETPALQMGTRHRVPGLNTQEHGKFSHKTPPDLQPLRTEHTESAQTALKQQLRAAIGNDPPIPTAKHQSCVAVLALTLDWGY